MKLCEMGLTYSTQLKIPKLEELMQETGFSSAHIIRLHDRFKYLDREKKGHLCPQDFGEIKGLAMNPIGDRIIDAFFPPGRETVDFQTFVRILAHFRPVDKNRPKEPNSSEPINSRINKLKFVFQMYDLDKDGKISRHDLLKVLRGMLEMQVTDEQLDSIAERTIQEADLDGDGTISFEEFRKSLEKVNIDHKMSIRFLR
ncbi:calcineurin B homologous protein 2 [Paramisgurnus dabryanus]|uniref:calcineurin B homologous protein 2 n=1 Tax=Paramisgurnus dabryanus TaxID=90735 RepID=UPI0031F396B0